MTQDKLLDVDKLEGDLKRSKSDSIHTLAKAGINLIPAGGAIVELFNETITPPISRRRDHWIILIASALNELDERIDEFKIENLSENEFFITMVLHATNIALRNHQESKIDALKNAIINCALNINPEEDLEMIFLHLIDSFTDSHLKILNILHVNEPKKRYEEIMRQVYYNTSANGNITRLNDTISFILPKLMDNDIIDLIINDLEKNNLINVQKHFFIDTSLSENAFYFYHDGTTSPTVSEIGKKFLLFISQPDID